MFDQVRALCTTLNSPCLYHALELWDWFASIGQAAPLARIADDILALATHEA